MRLFLLSCFLVLPLACGGGGDEQDVERFATSYRAVTENFQAQIDDAKSRAELNSSEGLDGVISIYEQILDSTAEAREELAELEPPGDLDSSFERMLELLDQQEAALSQLVDAAKDRDTTAVAAAASRLNELTSDWNQIRAEVEDRLR